MIRQPRSTPSCTKRNSAGQPPTCSNTARRIADRSLPDDGDLARRAPGRRRAAAAPSRAARAAVARLAGRSWTSAEPRVGREQRARRARARRARRCARRRRGRRAARRARAARRRCGPPGCRRRAAAPTHAHAVGHAVRLAAVADDDDVGLDALLALQRLDRGAQVVRPPPGGQHDAAERRRHRSRSEPRIATSRPTRGDGRDRHERDDQHARRLQVAEREVEQRRREREQRRLDRDERAEEREEAERAAQPRAAASARGADGRGGVLRRGGLPDSARATCTSTLSIRTSSASTAASRPSVV